MQEVSYEWRDLWGVSSVSVDAFGEMGTYSVYAFVEFPEGWLEEVVLSTYAEERPVFSEIAVVDKPALRIVTMEGFANTFLNGKFVERRGSRYEVNGFETYWSQGYMLYYCKKIDVWGITRGDMITKLKNGQCDAFAQSNPMTDLLAAVPNKGWNEYVGFGWTFLPEAGVKTHTGFGTKIDYSVMVNFPSNQSSFIQATTANANTVELEAADHSTARSAPSTTCRIPINRLSKLDNGESIASRGIDRQFPTDMASIAHDGEMCGDAARGIQEKCEKYNHWRSLADIMGDDAFKQ